MRDWRGICKRLLFLPGWLMIIFSLVSAVALATIFIKEADVSPIAYIVYVFSAYTLIVDCIFFTLVLPKIYKNTKRKVYEHPVGNRYMTDAEFKVKISLYISVAINITYSVFKLIAGIIYSSSWLEAVAVYYILLSMLRLSLLRYMLAEKTKKEILLEYKRYRLCGILMLILNLSLSGIVFQMVWQNEGYNYPGVLIFAVAAYTFYAVTISIVDIFRYRKFNSPVLSASKAIRFASAIVSLLALETAMLAQFGEDEFYNRIMTACTGAGVCIIVLAISLFMIAHSNKEIKTLQGEIKNGK